MKPKYSIGDCVYVGSSCLIVQIDEIIEGRHGIYYRMYSDGGRIEMPECELSLSPTRKECHSEAVCRLVETLGKNCPLHCGHFLPKCVK